MNKDALLATAIGFFIGLCITGLLLVGPSVIQKIPKISITLPQLPKSQTKKVDTSIKKAADIKFTIDSPLNESIESEKELLVSGTAPAKSTIVIESSASDVVVIATDDNKFAGKISLIEGQNDIKVTSYSNGMPSTLSITVYHTSEEL